MFFDKIKVNLKNCFKKKGNLKKRKKKAFPLQGSNRGPLDLQSDALPMELLGSLSSIEQNAIYSVINEQGLLRNKEHRNNLSNFLTCDSNNMSIYVEVNHV